MLAFGKGAKRRLEQFRDREFICEECRPFAGEVLQARELRDSLIRPIGERNGNGKIERNGGTGVVSS